MATPLPPDRLLRGPEATGYGAGYGWVPQEPGINPGGADLHEVLRLLRRHAWLVVFCVLIGVGIAGYGVYREVPLFRATAVVRIVDTAGALTGGINSDMVDRAVGVTGDPLLSQLQVLQSRSIAGEVVDRSALRLQSLTREFGHGSMQGLVVDESFEPDTIRIRFEVDGYVAVSSATSQASAYGIPVDLGGVRFAVAQRPAISSATLVVASREAAMGVFLGGLAARPRDRTNVVDLAFTDQDPHRARNAVNATVAVFQEQSALAAQQQSRRRREFIEGQLAQTDSVLADAQYALTLFRSEQQVLSPGDQLAAQQAAMIQLDMRREELLADRSMYDSLLRGLLRAGDNDSRKALSTIAGMPGIASNSIVSGLYGQLVEYETAVSELTTGELRLAESHPDVVRLRRLIDSTHAQLVEGVRSHIAVQDARVAAMEDLSARSGESLAGLPQLQAREARLAQQVASLSEVADQLREEHQRARIAEAVESGQVEVVDLAAGPGVPLGSGSTRKVLFGLMIGLMAGGGGAYLIERMNTAINRREELEFILHLPGLAVIPKIPGRNRAAVAFRRILGLSPGGTAMGALRGGTRSVVPDVLQQLVTVGDLRSAGAEAYRTLRTNLIFTPVVESLRTVVVTSALSSEGKTTTAANLAVTFAQQGMRALLIDCDLRRPQVDVVFGIPRSPGLTDLLAQRGSAQDAIRSTSIEGLDVLPCGAIPANPVELLGGEKMKILLATLARHYRIIVIDTPPLLAAADGSVLGTAVDGVVLVVRAGRTERAAALQAVQQLEGVGARVIGAVLNDPDAKVPQYGNYYYYGDYYGAEV